jgi:ADP-heptose:LPS heptosyltransferase
VNRRRDRWLKRVLEWGLRPFLSRSPRDLRQIQATKPRRILVVRQHNQMGDMLCATPALDAVKATFPGARTLVVTAPVNDGVVRGHPSVDGILLFDKRTLRSSPRAAWRFLRTLRAFRAEVAIVLNSVSFSSTSAWIARLSGAAACIGGSSLPFGWSFSRWLYDLEIPTTKELGGHAIDHGLRGLRAVGFRIPGREPRLHPSIAARFAARRFLDSVGEGRRVALHPGAGKEANRWPSARFAAVARELGERGFAVYLVEGPADGPAVAEVQARLDRPLAVLRDVDVATVAAALAASDLALVNDTGLMHVAGAVGVPTLALFGPTPPEEWAPPSPALKALRAADGRMESLDTGSVLVELLGRLAPGEAL